MNEIDDLEDRYSLAMEVGLYSAGLETLICLKDRERVGNFINSVPLQKHYEIRERINQVLMNSVINYEECHVGCGRSGCLLGCCEVWPEMCCTR